MAMPSLEPLTAHLAGALKTVRLRALQEDPTAFGSTYAKEAQLSDDEWLERVTTWNSGNSACYLAMEESVPCGIIAGYLDKNDPQRAHVVSMWVAPTHRRTGLGSALIEKIEMWARGLQARELFLLVTSNNAAAFRFYERCGFAANGYTEPYPNDPDVVACGMIKPL
jgi:ribosomal protein S18 acetylase RimI-like enzyme